MLDSAVDANSTRRIFRTMVGLALAFIFFVGLLVFSGLNDRLGHADIGLVLGNQVSPDGTPSARLQARLDRAAELYREGWFPMIVVSGATGVEGFPEGTAMKNYLVSVGIPADAIIVDDLGFDTWASARNTARILQEHNAKRVFVITQFYHIPRSRLALSRFGVTTIYHAHADYFEARDTYSTLREIPAWLKYRLRPAEGG